MQLPGTATAATIFWDGTGSSWNNAASWSTVSNATTPNPAAPPGAGDIATFNITSVNTAQTVNLDAAQSALGLAFNSTGTVLIESASGGGSTNSLTLGASGITHAAGAGADTISAPVILSAPQSWVNNSSGIFTASDGVDLAGNALSIDGGATTTFSGALSGAGGVTKFGSAALRLNASNTFTGGLTIDVGPVILGNAGALNSTTPNAVSFGADSVGALTLNGNSVTVSGLSTSATVGSPFVENKSATAATLTVNNSSDNTYAGLLQDSAGGGALSLTKSGAGALTLSGANTFTGATTINAGTLVLGNANALGATAGGTSVAGGTLDLGGQSVGAEPLTISGAGVGGNGALVNSSAAAASLAGTVTVNLPLTTVGGSGNITLSGSVNGNSILNAVLTKTGSGTLTLSGATDNNSLAVTVNSGTVVLAKTSSGSPNDVHAIGGPGLVVNGGTAQLGGTGGDQIYDSATVTVTSGTFDMGGQNETIAALKLQGSGISGAGALVNTSSDSDSNLTVTGGTVLTGNATIGVFLSSVNGVEPTLELDNPISGSFALTKTGAGALVLSGANSFSGGLTVANGNLSVSTFNNAGTSGPLGNNTSVTLGSSGNTAYLAYGGFSASTNMPIVLAAGGTGALVDDLVGSNLTLNGVISGSGTLYAFSGIITLGGINSFTGGVTIGDCDLRLANGGALNANTVTFLDNFGPTNPGKLSLQGHNATVGGLSTSGSGTLQDVVQNGSPTAATLTINNSSANTFAGILQDGTSSAALSILKFGSGALTLGGNNTFTGTMTVNAGTLVLGNANALGATAGGTTIGSGATLDLGGQTIGAEPLTIAGTGLGGNGALINSSVTAATFGGTITNQTFTVGGSGNINLTGSINGTSTLTKVGTGTLTLSGTTDNTGLSLAVDAGTVVLAKTSSHAPDVHAVGWNAPLFGMVVNGGTAQLGGTGGDQIYDSATVTVTSGAFDTNGQTETFATLNLQGGGIGGAGALVNTAAGSSTITPTGGTTLNAATTIGVTQSGGSLTLNNGISGNFMLTKVGAGTLTLSGSSNFTGGLNLNDGITRIVGPSAAGQGALTMASSATLLVLLGGTTQFTQYDHVNVLGQLSLAGTLNVSLINSFSPAIGNSFDILDWGTESGAFSSINLPSLSAGLAWNTTKLYSTGVLSVIDANYLPGDVNRDGRVDAADVSALMSALADLSTYQATHGIGGGALTNQQLLQITDLDGDGAVTNADVQALIDLLANGLGSGGGSVTAVPEPATMVLALLGFWAVGVVEMRRSRLQLA
jgi:autotransporter-associated beta strand protein